MSNPTSEKRDHYESVKKYFHNDAAEYEQYYDVNNINELHRNLRRRNDWKMYTSVLDGIIAKDEVLTSTIDVGCGIGNFLLELVRRNQFTTIVGMDFLQETMKIAHARSQYFSTVDFMQGDLLNIPFKDRSFDLTVCVNVLHHIHKEDFSKAIDELARITRKYLMIEVRNRNNLLEFFYQTIVLQHRYKNLPQYTISIPELHHLLQRNGFVLERVKGKLPVAWLCRRIVCIYKRID